MLKSISYFVIMIFFVPFPVHSQDADQKVKYPENNLPIELVEAILHHPTVSKYLHYDIPERQPLKLLVNQHISSDLQIFYRSDQVKLTDNKEKIADLLEIRFSDIKCSNDEILVDFSFLSNIEGLGISGRAEKTENGDWKIKILKVVFI